MTGLKNLKIRVGETIKYDLTIGGEPPPEVSWVVNDKPLKTGGRVKITTEKKKTILKVENAERSDSGKYTIVLKNSSGEETGTAQVIVVGKPQPPKGPLTVADVHKDGCTLAWEAPPDDGGEPIEGSRLRNYFHLKTILDIFHFYCFL